MNKLLEDVYYRLENCTIDKNPFYDEEERKIEDAFCDKYIPRDNDIIDEFGAILNTRQALAFDVGFKTAVKLIFDKDIELIRKEG